MLAGMPLPLISVRQFEKKLIRHSIDGHMGHSTDGHMSYDTLWMDILEVFRHMLAISEEDPLCLNLPIQSERCSAAIFWP